mmetsp:Transcript_50316/g.133596  ORF Transcript_50316/g.133596 Transcript_50316/m.133596 type:complete len:100 (+) Transcript_50316:80-379(+)
MITLPATAEGLRRRPLQGVIESLAQGQHLKIVLDISIRTPAPVWSRSAIMTEHRRPRTTVKNSCDCSETAQAAHKGTWPTTQCRRLEKESACRDQRMGC